MVGSASETGDYRVASIILPLEELLAIKAAPFSRCLGDWAAVHLERQPLVREGRAQFD